MNTEFEFLAIKYATELLHTKDVLEYANAQLKSGVQSDVSLEMLDCDPKDWRDILELIEKYLKEMGKVVPDLEKAVRSLVEYHVTLITSGAVILYERFTKLLADNDSYD